MAVTTFVKPVTNIGSKTELYELLTELNDILGEEKCIIEEYRFETRTGFLKLRKLIKKVYYIYWDIEVEYQVMFGGNSVSEEVAKAYLLGYIGGLQKNDEILLPGGYKCQNYILDTEQWDHPKPLMR